MSSNFERLRRQVLSEVQRQRGRKQRTRPINQAELLGEFLQAGLTNLGYSTQDFAQKLGVEQEFAEALLDGLLPASEIDTLLIDEIAEVVEYDSKLLHILLGRDTSASSGSYGRQSTVS